MNKQQLREVGLLLLLMGLVLFGSGALGVEWPGMPVYKQLPFLTAQRLQMIYGVVFVAVGLWLRVKPGKAS
jgi:hypothetical protein